MSGRKGKGGRDGVREGIEGAKVVPLRPAAEQAAKPAPAAPSSMSRRFVMKDDGLYKIRPDGEGPDVFLSGPIEVLGETRDGDSRSWGLLLRWSDRDGCQHEEAFARALFSGDGTEIRARLADGGLTLNPAPHARTAFMEWMAALKSGERARSVTQIGWHRLPSGQVFVLPDVTIGEAGERVVLQTVDREPSLFNVAGTLDDWRNEIGARCVGNSRLVFAACCAFAAPLLGLFNEEGGGFSFKGSSRIGKSTTLSVAASVCGGTPAKGSTGYFRNWRATTNGLESVALSSCDVLLPLDEMGQLDAKEAGEVAYLLANGQGKARANRQGSARSIAQFRLLFLSTGEVGISDLNREAGKTTKAGQEVRFADMPADAGAGMGLFEDIHGEDSPDLFSNALREATFRIYGAPLRAFLVKLTDAVRPGPSADDFLAGLRQRSEELLEEWLRLYPDASGQVRSVARRFALVAIGGELASRFGQTGWALDVAPVSVGICFRAWLAERGTAGRREEDQAVAQLRDFLSRHGESRFEKWVDGPQDGRQVDDAHMPPAERFRTQNRAGWRRWIVETDADGSAGIWRYFLTADGMNEALAGLNLKDANRTLVERGFVLPGKDRASRLISPPGFSKIRVYEVLATILGSTEGDR